MIQYADDTLLVSHNQNLKKTMHELQTLSNAAEEWFSKWRLQVNPTKSQLIIFYHKISNSSPFITINNHQVNPSVTVKYLGINLDNKLNFKQHTSTTKKKVISRAKHFRVLTYRKQGITYKTASKIYKSICRPLLEYGHTLYLNCKKPSLKNIQTAETCSLRAISKMRHPNNPLHNPSNFLLYQNLGIDQIGDRLVKLSSKFAAKTSNLEMMEPLWMDRTPNTQARFKYPEKTLKEIIISLSEGAN